MAVLAVYVTELMVVMRVMHIGAAALLFHCREHNVQNERGQLAATAAIACVVVPRVIVSDKSTA